jgi:hypothetical protein
LEADVATLLTYRDTIRKLSPPWLQNGLAERILYALALHVDVFGDSLAAGVKQRFPGLYSSDALPLIGRERRLRRGLVETDETYALRLTRWLLDHRRRGGPYALLAQLYAYYAPGNFPITLLYQSGRRYSMDAAGAVVRDDIAWSPDASSAQWARWWLIFETDTFGTPTADQIADLQHVPREWNAAHCLGFVVLRPAGAELIDYPDGAINQPGTINTTIPTTTIAVDS